MIGWTSRPLEFSFSWTMDHFLCWDVLNLSRILKRIKEKESEHEEGMKDTWWFLFNLPSLLLLHKATLGFWQLYSCVRNQVTRYMLFYEDVKCEFHDFPHASLLFYITFQWRGNQDEKRRWCVVKVINGYFRTGRKREEVVNECIWLNIEYLFFQVFLWRLVFSPPFYCEGFIRSRKQNRLSSALQAHIGVFLSSCLLRLSSDRQNALSCWWKVYYTSSTTNINNLLINWIELVGVVCWSRV